VNASALTAVAAGGRHTLAVAADGAVWAWGRKQHGQFGDGTASIRSAPQRVEGLGAVRLAAAEGVLAQR